MRFFISSNIKNNYPLYITVVLFLISSFLYWALGWFMYHNKYGLSFHKQMFYFFTDPEFPEPIPLGQLLEDIHVQIFMTTLFILILASIFVHKCVRDKVKYTLIGVSFTAGMLEPVTSLLVYYISPVFIYLKILLFILFQVSCGIMVIMSLKLYLTKEKEEPPERSILYTIVFVFSVSTLLFTAVNFFLFLAKMGFSPSSVAEYYAGNPQKFMRPKSLYGLLDVVTPHLLAMGVYLFALIHFAFFTNVKRKALLSATTLGFAFMDNVSGLGIRFWDTSFSYLKLVSFFGLTLCMAYLSLLISYSILRHRAKAIVLL